MATWPGMRERTITISGLSKTFSCTGWRLGYVVAPRAQTAAIRKVHDFLTVGAPAPLQAAGAVGMHFDADYFNHLALDYRARRTLLCDALTRGRVHASRSPRARTTCSPTSPPERHGRRDVREVDVRGDRRGDGAGLELLLRPRRSGKSLVRFAFCKKYETLKRAADRLVTVACERC